MRRRIGGLAGFVIAVMLLGVLSFAGPHPEASALGNAEVSVTKMADKFHVHPNGEDVTFTVTVANFSGLEIVDIIDDVFGNLVNPTDPRVSDSDCIVGSSDAYVCTFTAFVASDGTGAHQNIVRVFLDDFGPVPSNPVTIDFIGISATKSAFPSVLPAAGGDVTYTFGVTNPGMYPMEITSLVDDIFEDLNGVGDCVVPMTLNPGEGDSCSATFTLGPGSPGTPHVNTLTATATRAEELQENVANLVPPQPINYIAEASASVDFVTTGISASKSASPTSVPESGGDVTFTYGVTNTGEIDVVVDSLMDDMLGNLDGQGDCQIGATVTPGSTYTCAVTKNLSGTADSPHVNVFTANATTIDTEDLEENAANATAGHQASASATVTFIAPEATPEPTPEPTSVPLIRRDPLLPAEPEPTPVPTAAPAAAVPAAEPAEQVDALAFTSTESSTPAMIALSSITAGALLLGVLRRREDRR